MGGGRRRAPRSRPRRRTVPLIWGACAVAAAVLALGSSGTLSAWSSAVITNSTNTAATTTAVILKEALGSTATCYSSSSPTNTSTCSTINKYGGATPMSPGGTQTVDVTFTNVGGANASTFALAPGGCTQTPLAGTGTAGALASDLCNPAAAPEFTVAVSCSPGSTYAAGAAWTDLAYAAAKPPTATKSHAATGGDLNSGASWTCRFTVALSASASVLDQGITVAQPLTWTLSQ